MFSFDTIYRKIRAFLIAVGIVSTSLFIVLFYMKAKSEKQIIASSLKQFDHEVYSLVKMNSSQMQQSVNDYSFWDEFVMAIENNDANWLAGNLSICTTYGYDYISVYNKSLNNIFELNYSDRNSQIVIPRGALLALAKSKFSHFYLSTNKGLIEVCGTSVHPTIDPDHTLTDPAGYMFVARVLNAVFLSKLTEISSSEVHLMLPADTLKFKEKNLVTAQINLKDWEMQPVSALVFSRANDVDFNRSTIVMGFLFGFIILVLFVTDWFARRYINNPLKLVTKVLHNDCADSIDILKRSNDEFGHLGHLFETYVNQKLELKVAIEKAQESETKFREIINQIMEGIVVIDDQGRVIIWNKGAEQITGLKADLAIHRHIADIQYQYAIPAQKDREKIRAMVRGIITMQTPQFYNNVMENEIIRLDSKEKRSIQSKTFPIKLQNYNLFCTLIRDSSSEKQFEKLLLQLNADKDRFIAILAHDLKSPFNYILGFSHILMQNIRKFSIEQTEEYLVQLENASKHYYHLLDDLLLWVNSHSGKMPFDPTKVEFREVLDEVLEILSPHANEKDIAINVTVEDDSIVLADINMIKTVMRNLITNAIKFTNKGGHVDVKVKNVNGSAVITVSDNGIGISADDLKKLFDYSQVRSTVGTASEKGSGLGLVLCKEFVEKHYGKLWVESEKGSGSSFSFTLPLFVAKDLVS